MKKINKKTLWIGSGLCLVLALGCGIGYWVASGDDEITYREVLVEY